MSIITLTEGIGWLLIASGISGLFFLLIAWRLIAWRNKAVKKAIQDLLDGQYKSKCEADRYIDNANKEKQSRLQASLSEIWEEMTILAYRLHGTSQQDEEDLLESLEWGMLRPNQLVLPELHRPFHVELMAIARGLTHLKSQIHSARAKREDLEFYRQWVQDLGERFQAFEQQQKAQQCCLQSHLSEISILYAEIGKAYWRSYCPTYSHFMGMLHIVQTMADEAILPAKELSAYVEALKKQLVFFVKHCEKDSVGYIPSAWSPLPRLEALLSELELELKTDEDSDSSIDPISEYIF